MKKYIRQTFFYSEFFEVYLICIENNTKYRSLRLINNPGVILEVPKGTLLISINVLVRFNGHALRKWVNEVDNVLLGKYVLQSPCEAMSPLNEVMLRQYVLPFGQIEET